MGKKFGLFLACMFMAVGMAFAQKQITGTVVDAENGEPLIGVAVRVPSTNKGVLTDVNGKFSVSLPQGEKHLNFSFMGMKPATVNAHNGMLVRLEPNALSKDEVMVVAYGTQKKSSFTGSAAIVDASEIGKVQVTNAADALRGKAAGVQIYNGTGQPGYEPSIRIRGFNSLIAGQQPLIVVDGSPYDGALTDINPVDIESMTVLKDAASTALYGARGGNGVILITTKSAAKGKDATITVDAKWGVNSKGSADYDRITNPAGYYETYYKGLYNYAKNINGYNDTRAWQWANAHLIDRTGGFGLGYNVYNVPEGQVMIGTNGKINPNATLGNLVTGPDGNQYYLTPDNADDYIYHHSLRQEYTLSANGATDKGGFYMSANYLNMDGITPASDFNRFTARLKADYRLKKWIKLGGNFSYVHSSNNSLDDEGDSSTGNMFALHNMAPIYPMFVRDANGNIIYDNRAKINAYDYGDGTYHGLVRAWLNQSNPISDAYLNTNASEGNSFNGTGDMEIYLPYGFTFYSVNNVYLTEYRGTSVTNRYFGQYASQNGIVSKSHSRDISTNFQQRLDWHKVYGQHDVEVMLGHEYYKQLSYGLYYGMSNMAFDDNKELAGAVVAGSGSSSKGAYNTESWLARAMYSYADRYFAQASAMRQGSSAFHPDHRWGTFYSASLGWMINNEKWFNADWVNNLKFKASYGENGNDFGLNGYYYTTRYGISNSNDNVSLVPSTLGKNEKFSWEKNAKLNIGFDFGFLNDRIWGSIDFYNNITRDLISSVPYAPSFGLTSYYTNVGNMRNTGVEIDLHADVIRTQDFTWNVYANMTTNKNKITKLADERKLTEVDGCFGYSSGNYFYTEGKSRYSFYSYKYAGVYNEQTYKSMYTKQQIADGEAKYDPSMAGKALYYHHVYAKDENGDIIKEQVDGRDKKVVQEIITTDKPGTDDMFVVGDVLPKVYGGIGTGFNYKGFDLSFDFQYQIGGKVYDSEYRSLMSFTAGYGMHADMLKAWSADNVNSDIPRIQYADSYMASTSDRFLTNAGYFSLQNITLGYTIPANILKKAGIQKIRVYGVADNIAVWSHRKGLDPRQSPTGGSNGMMYSPIRSISGGINVVF